MTNPEKIKQAETFTDKLRKVFEEPLKKTAELMSRWGFYPDTLTTIGALLTGISAVFIAKGEFLWAGLWFMMSGPFDALDGALARFQDRRSSFGAFFDSFVDRYIEIFVYGGFLYYFYSIDSLLGVMVAYIAASGSILVSYARSRAEGLGFSIKDGFFTRVERFIVIVLILLFQSPMVGIVILAIGNNLTAFQRAWSAYKLMKE